MGWLKEAVWVARARFLAQSLIVVGLTFVETVLDWCGLGFGFRENGRFASSSLGCFICCLGLLLALGSACSSSTSPMESTLPAQGSGGSLLPGESINDALQRLTDSCMEPFGFRYTITYPVGDDGPFPFRVYDGDPVVQARHRGCLALAAQGAGIRKLSFEELKGNWEFQTAVWACLAGRGYDVGTLVSLEEFVAAGGAVDAASKASDFGGLDQPNADADMQACVAEVG